MGTKHITASTIILNHGDEIKKLKERGVTVTALVNKYGCARNTMNKVLVNLGFNGPKWLTGKDKK